MRIWFYIVSISVALVAVPAWAGDDVFEDSPAGKLARALTELGVAAGRLAQLSHTWNHEVNQGSFEPSRDARIQLKRQVVEMVETEHDLLVGLAINYVRKGPGLPIRQFQDFKRLATLFAKTSRSEELTDLEQQIYEAASDWSRNAAAILQILQSETPASCDVALSGMRLEQGLQNALARIRQVSANW